MAAISGLISIATIGACIWLIVESLRLSAATKRSRDARIGPAPPPADPLATYRRNAARWTRKVLCDE